MSNFLPAIRLVLEHEGELVHHPDDPGGLTKYGITKRDHPDIDIENLTREAAIEIYHNRYWRPEYEQLPQLVAIKVFDMAVNMGWPQAHRLLQQALNRLGDKLDVDGLIGPKTLAAADSHPVNAVLKEIRAGQSYFYAMLALDRPQMKVFLLGWMRRAAA